MLLYIEMFLFSVAAVSITDYLAKSSGSDVPRLIGCVVCPLIAPFSTAYQVFIFGAILSLLRSPEPMSMDMVEASLLRRRYGNIFGTVGAAMMLAGLTVGFFNIINS